MKHSVKIVLTFGTFDKFHPGHEYFLTEAKKYGDRLIVVIARDHNVEKLKGKLPHDTEDIRQANVAKYTAVNEAMLGRSDFSQRYSVIDEVQPQVICLGYDQALDFKSPSPNIQVIRLKAFHPEQYKSSLL